MPEQSLFLQKSVICLDGFTGFTPSQYKLLHTLLRKAEDIYVTVTIDPIFCGRALKEHELFYLSSQTIKRLTEAAQNILCNNCNIQITIFFFSNQYLNF